MKHKQWIFFFFLVWISGAVGACKAATVSIVVSVRPLYGIVAALTQGIAEPKLFLETADSPHGYTLKPGDISKLSDADLIIWIGPAYESFLQSTLQDVPEEKKMKLQTLPGIQLLPLRKGGWWGDHAHTHHHEGESSSHKDHAHAVEDGHIWLSPKNGELIAQAVATRLKNLMPAQEAAIEQNLNAFIQNLTATTQEIADLLQKAQDRPFVVFHDSYRYFEEAFGLKSVGAVLIDPELPANAYHINRLRQILKKRGAVCLFKEPQFEVAIVDALEEQSACRSGVLDPLGTELPLSATHYLDLLRNLAYAFSSCLSSQ